jgi:hypothetical protein
MITSTYGVKIMEDGDKGQPVFDAMNDNFEHYRDHTHDGTDSSQIASTDIDKESLNLSAASWVVTGLGNGYKQTVTCPGSVTLANSLPRFRIRTGANIHKIIYPTIIPASLTQFDVVVNDNSLDLEVLFL